MSAYIIARITVTNPQDYQTYASQTVATAEKFGGRFLAKGGVQDVLEGICPDRHVIIEFPDRATALDWYGSDAYRRILPIAMSSSERDIVLVDGI
ncbi:MULTISPECIES: DUF1330 domain-containing protein [unclassified Roseovarius]|jgi:uncharacterized protein (DUF1330 family)|uniref:DUF1330 domain-containing protein n=1 Tax=unclassified Roseovarius TaxID=2614913 RepID=UPI0000685AD2|nr:MULTISPECIES: DUF1330 domain-containing protein [unclassified Roseovarius]EAQ27020.1 hypothetical protein ROS217_20877 [Roseovarius sp. 217]KJS42169.1 MAG: hypothetical protein VR71_16035 [Roseovarius sp. BRH_c41]